MQIRDALPAEPDALAAVAAQITELALERANDNQVKQTEALQNALSTRDAQAAELQVKTHPPSVALCNSSSASIHIDSEHFRPAFAP